jgi:hypothetical protein
MTTFDWLRNSINKTDKAAERSMAWNPPPKIEELYAKTDGNLFSGLNKPTAGAQSEASAEKGSAPVQLYR